MSNCRAVLFILVLSFPIPIAANLLLAQTGTDPTPARMGHLKQVLQAELDAIVASEKWPGASLAIVLDKHHVLELASGLEDRESEKKMKVGARMLGGSTGKTFVAAVALQLVESGKIGLDDRVADYFDKRPGSEWFDQLPNAQTLTVRSLMNHTSGLPRYLFTPDYLADLRGNPLRDRKPLEGLKSLQGKKPLHPVGEGWVYSDSNYLLLGLIIEQVTGRAYYEIVQQDLLTPLELVNTVPSTQPEISGLIPGYIGSNNFFELPAKTVTEGRYAMHPGFEWCGGGFATNTRDLASWLYALHSGRVLSETMLHQMVNSPIAIGSGPSPDVGYGLGCFVWHTEQGIFYGHAGIMPGYLTQMEYSVEHDFAIALQTNTDEGLGTQLHAIVQRLAGRVIQSGHRKKLPD